MVSKKKMVSRGLAAGQPKKAVAVLVKRAAALPKVSRSLTGAGQHFLSSGLCIATDLTCKPCASAVGAAGVPYCKRHMNIGDPSFKVVKHPLAGKILVAARTLPKGYRIALWGPQRRKKEMSAEGMEWAFHITKQWMIDPTSCKGSLVQFCPCAGPNEAAALLTTPVTATPGMPYGAWAFITRERIQKNWQMTMQYGSNSKDSDEFFTERGLIRVDVGTKTYPALRRKDKASLK